MQGSASVMKLVKLSPDSSRPDNGLLDRFEDCLRQKGQTIFSPDVPVTAARGPARIDVMGGIADYSGSLVFEGTLGQAAVVGFQKRRDRVLRVKSTLLEEHAAPCEVELSLDDLRSSDRPLSYAKARTLLTADKDKAWAAYVLGAIPVLEKEAVLRLESGANFLLWSDIPIGVGVASSAAVEVAAMFALVRGMAAELDGQRLAALAQVVENRVAGAPCGIMDQVTSALGEAGKLLALRCQPCDVLGQHELPKEVRVFGISSRVRHSVGGDEYTTARVSAFMGLKVILTEMKKRGMRITKKNHYLCNMPPKAYRRLFRDALPETIRGEEFLKTYGETTDAVTRVNPDKAYRVRLGTEHPIFENYRVETFIECIERAHAGDRTALVEAGGLMYASHLSYGWNCGLGCPETDLLVKLVREQGPERGLYGAKITGGGCGGTVAILADTAAEDTVRAIAAEYEKRTGITPDLFDGTSPGAYAFGERVYRLE